MGITAINGIDISSSLALTASTTTVTDTTTGTGPYYLVFVDGNTGARRSFVDSSTLTYNATSNTITANTFAGTASAASRLDVSTLSSNATHYLLFTPNFNAGGTNPSPVSESSNVTFNPSTLEFRAAIVNATSTATRANTADANLTIDASLTQSMTWIASFTTTRSLIVTNLTDGREVNVWIRNTNASPQVIVFSGSTSTTGQSVSMSRGGTGAPSTPSASISASNGILFVNMRTIFSTTFGTIT